MTCSSISSVRFWNSSELLEPVPRFPTPSRGTGTGHGSRLLGTPDASLQRTRAGSRQMDRVTRASASMVKSPSGVNQEEPK